MLYSEFIEGTGCKDTEQNYNIYKGLELIYMNSELSKSDIYRMGKKLVNNDLTPEQKAFNESIQSRINELNIQLESDVKMLDYYKNIVDANMIKYYKNQIISAKRKIQELKSILYN